MLSLFSFSTSPQRVCHARAMALLACGLMALASVSGPAAAAPPVEQAVTVVHALYEAHGQRYRNGEPPVLNEAEATRLYFADALASDGLQGRLGFDPLYNAQAAQITDLTIGLDPEHRVLRGTALVNASFRNFGQPMRLGFLLRVLPPAGDWQIINVRYDGVGEAGAGAWLLSDLIAATGGAGHDGASATGPNERVTLFSSAEAEAEATPSVIATSADGEGSAAANRMLVFDGSGSMWQQIDGQYKVTIAQQVVSDLLDTLGPDETLGLVAYGHREKGNCADIETLVPPGRNTADAVRIAVAAIKPKGKTPLSAAVMEAARQLRFVEDAATVILISDGRETCDRDPCAVGRELDQAGLDFTAHVIGFDVAAPEDRAQLRCLAENTGGRFLTAANATELSDALTQVATAPAPQPEPEPEPAPAAALFEDTFDGTALKPHWTVVNAEPALTDVSEGTLWVASAYNKRGPRTAEAPNRLVLDQSLPDGDWDLVLDVSMLVQTGHEAVTVGLFDDADNQTSAYFWLEWEGCGPAPGLTLFSRRGNGDDDPSETKFQQDLFKGAWGDDICYAGGRAHADRVLDVLEQEGATLRLSRRGRALSASVEMTIPPRDGAEGATAEPVRIETEPVTVLRPSGRVSVWAGQWGNTREREAILRLDRFAIEAVN